MLKFYFQKNFFLKEHPILCITNKKTYQKLVFKKLLVLPIYSDFATSRTNMKEKETKKRKVKASENY